MERIMNDTYISAEGGLNGISLENELVVSITLCERVGYHFVKKQEQWSLVPKFYKSRNEFLF